MEEGAMTSTPQKEAAIVVETPDAPVKKRERPEEQVENLPEPEVKAPKPEEPAEESATPPTLPLPSSGEEVMEGAYLSQEHADEPLPTFDARLAEEGMRFEEEKKRAAELSENAALTVVLADLHLSIQSKILFNKESLECLFPQVYDNCEDLTKTLNIGTIFEAAFTECCEKEFFQVSEQDQYSVVADPKTIVSMRERLNENFRKRLVQLGCDLLKTNQ